MAQTLRLSTFIMVSPISSISQWQAQLQYRYYSNLIADKFIMLTLSKQTRQYTYQIPECHNKLNQYGKLALSNHQESYRSVYHSRLNHSQEQTKRGQQETLSTLLLTERSRPVQTEVNPELQRSIQKLEIMGLYSPKEVRHVRFEGHIKIPTVHNDYHTRATNHGFSRSETGGIFPK